MRLKSLKLAGFKSFVDPIEIDFPGIMCGIVGPNGCGKSNIIDAIKWVKGELSAKSLRSESLQDVIFNGSDNRKPVSHCSVELCFDNSENFLGGEYLKFEIRYCLKSDQNVDFRLFLDNIQNWKLNII